MSPVEIVASLFGLVNVALVVRRSIWNYPFALAMVTLYAWIFFDAKLYSDALLQPFYIVVNLYGWWNWSRSRATSGQVLVQHLGNRARLAGLAGCVMVILGWGAMMHGVTDTPHPWWDGSVAMLSVAAQILQSRRKWECWVLWIAVDVIAIPLFAVKGLWLTAGLYGIFLALSVWGLIDWIRAKA